MTEREVSEAVVDWIGSTVSPAIPTERRYAYPVTVTGALPDCVAVVDEKTLAERNPEMFPAFMLEQTWVRTFTVGASIMVAVDENSEAKARETHQELQAYGAALEVSALNDATLGSRLEDGSYLSPVMAFQYADITVERPDGSTGRILPMRFHVGEPIAGPE